MNQSPQILKHLPNTTAYLVRKVCLIQSLYTKYKRQKDEITNKQVQYILANDGILSGELQPNSQAYLREYQNIINQSQYARALLTENQLTIDQCLDCIQEMLQKLGNIQVATADLTGQFDSSESENSHWLSKYQQQSQEQPQNQDQQSSQRTESRQKCKVTRSKSRCGGKSKQKSKYKKTKSKSSKPKERHKSSRKPKCQLIKSKNYSKSTSKFKMRANSQQKLELEHQSKSSRKYRKCVEFLDPQESSSDQLSETQKISETVENKSAQSQTKQKQPNNHNQIHNQDENHDQ